MSVSVIQVPIALIQVPISQVLLIQVPVSRGSVFWSVTNTTVNLVALIPASSRVSPKIFVLIIFEELFQISSKLQEQSFKRQLLLMLDN